MADRIRLRDIEDQDERRALRRARRKARTGKVAEAIERIGAPILADAVQAGLPDDEAVERAADAVIRHLDGLLALQEPAESISDMALALVVRPLVVRVLEDALEWADEQDDAA